MCLFFYQYVIDRSPRITLINNAIGGGYLSPGVCWKEDTWGVRRRLRSGAIITVFDVATVGSGTPADPVSPPPHLLLSLILNMDGNK